MTTHAYQVDEVEDAGQAPCSCDSCTWTGTAAQTNEVGSCALTPGDASPVGRCPECDALAYLDKPLRPPLGRQLTPALIEAAFRLQFDPDDNGTHLDTWQAACDWLLNHMGIVVQDATVSPSNVRFCPRCGSDEIREVARWEGSAVDNDECTCSQVEYQCFGQCDGLSFWA